MWAEELQQLRGRRREEGSSHSSDATQLFILLTYSSCYYPRSPTLPGPDLDSNASHTIYIIKLFFTRGQKKLLQTFVIKRVREHERSGVFFKKVPLTN